MDRKDGEGPRLVVENDPAELRRAQALQEISFPLRDLAANVMRVSRGAGKSYALGIQCAEVIASFERYRELTNQWASSWEIDAILRVRNVGLFESGYSEHDDAVDDIIGGSLQISASRLLDQKTQERAGEREMYSGLNSIVNQRVRRREEERQREQRERRLAKSASPKRRPRKGKS